MKQRARAFSSSSVRSATMSSSAHVRCFMFSSSLCPPDIIYIYIYIYIYICNTTSIRLGALPVLTALPTLGRGGACVVGR